MLAGLDAIPATSHQISGLVGKHILGLGIYIFFFRYRCQIDTFKTVLVPKWCLNRYLLKCKNTILECSHFPSCTFKSECENSTLALLQIFVGLVLLQLSEFSSRVFSQSANYFSRAVPVMMLLTSVSEKQRTNISTDRSGMAPK